MLAAELGMQPLISHSCAEEQPGRAAGGADILVACSSELLDLACSLLLCLLHFTSIQHPQVQQCSACHKGECLLLHPVRCMYKEGGDRSELIVEMSKSAKS